MRLRRCPASRLATPSRALLLIAAPTSLVLAGWLALAPIAGDRFVAAQPVVDPLAPPPELHPASASASDPDPASAPASVLDTDDILVAVGDFPAETETSWVEGWSPFPDAADPLLVEASGAVPVPDSIADPGLLAPEAWSVTYRSYLPGVRLEPAPTALQLGNRASVLAYYNAVYRVATPPMGWTGDFNSCSPGRTSPAYLEATRKRIVYYRAMAGVPTSVSMYAPFVEQAQAAALMMSANGQLDHTPSSAWRCYSEAGKEGAGKANLASAPGPAAIDLYMHEPGGNSAVGHRRWLLHPQLSRMGAGSTPNPGSAFGANALYVLDSSAIWSTRPAVRDGYVAWPPRGYVPFPIVPLRWSFSYPDADFSGATVTMWRSGAPLASVKETVVDGFGENTLVWRPQIGATTWPRPAGDTTYQVQINNVRISGANRTFAYTVVIFDPG